MSWSRRSLIAAAGAGAMALGLGGCGFEPLYGRREDGGSAAAELAAIRIAPIADRTGQLLYNELRDRLNPRGKPATPLYILRVTLVETREELAFRGDETATRANLLLTANYVLQRAASQGGSGEEVTVAKGESRVTASYDILESQYATLVSIDDARGRAVQVLGDDIQARLAVVLSRASAAAP